MKKLTILLALATLSFVCSAEKGQSIMFEEQEHPITQAPAVEEQSQGDRCEALSKKIESLKGNPQRRHAAMQQFKLECAERY
ncbi:MAG: hypothetical protein ABFR65_05625 [Pseudomonadota bacterium]